MKTHSCNIAFVFCIVWCAAVMAQPVSNDLKNVQQGINRPITRLMVKQKSNVTVMYDSVNYIEVLYTTQQGNPLNDKFIAVRGMTLIIDDPEGDAVYYVHLKEDELEFVTTDITSKVTYDFGDVKMSTEGEDAAARRTRGNGAETTTDNLALQQTLDEARKSMEEAKRQLKEWKTENGEQHIPLSLREKSDAQSALRAPQDLVPPNFGKHTENGEYGMDMKENYDWRDRTEVAFLWGFTNWGDSWYNGLSKMDGAYRLRTLLSSYQIEVGFAVLMTPHFNLSLGVNYESDLYQFSTPIVGVDANGVLLNDIETLPNRSYNDFVANNQLFAETSLEDWTSRLLTRYVGLPVTLGLRWDKFRISLTALPALSLNTRHTGLKHNLDAAGMRYENVQDMSNYIAPYKVDLRLEMQYGGIGVFVQTSTASLFNNGVDVYPIKVGFRIGN